MRLLITIGIDASETIIDTIKRGPFVVDNDGSGHKIKIGDGIIIPSRKCKVTFADKVKTKTKDDDNGIAKD